MAVTKAYAIKVKLVESRTWGTSEMAARTATLLVLDKSTGEVLEARMNWVLKE